MPDFSAQTEVFAPADGVFRFVSDVKNLPKYLPTVSRAAPQQGERVEVDGQANGHDYHSDGWFKVDEDARSLSWGSDGENDYRGELRVEGGDTARVSVSIHFSPKPEIARSMEKHQGGPDNAMQDGIEAALASIKRQCEGEGGKTPSSAER